MNKLQVYHFHNGTGGGVLSVIKSLLRYSTSEQLENHVIHAVNPKVVPTFKAEALEGAASEQVFTYQSHDNFYYTCTRLRKFLPDDKAMIIAHDWLELGMASNLGLQNPVVHFVHGAYNYYYHLASKHNSVIDRFVVVAEGMQQTLRQMLPHRRDDIFFLHLPVPVAPANAPREGRFKIIFIGRPEEAKGFHLLPAIANSLPNRHEVEWHIVGTTGSGFERANFKNLPVKFYGAIDNEAVQKLLQQMHLIVLPSLAEGMPVAIIEAMKAGVVPLVNDIPGGIQELIRDGITGYKIAGNEVKMYAEKIMSLIANPDALCDMQKEATAFANNFFDPVVNTKIFEEKMMATVAKNRNRKAATKVYGSRLDQQWIPNIFTSKIRRYLP